MLKSELNVFEEILQNNLYLLIQIVTIVGQIVIVTFGGRALRTQALSINQHIACGIIAAFSLVINFVVKLLPFDAEERRKDGSKVSIGGIITRTRSRTRTLPRRPE